jgi:hypothetical protein
MLYYVIAGLIAVILLKDLIHRIERKDLYNRLMARDLTEYKQEVSKSDTVQAHRKVLEKWRRTK